MFTGLIQTIGRVDAINSQSTGSGARLTIAATDWAHLPNPGDSICVSGCCLTLVGEARSNGDTLRLDFDVVSESLAKTNLGDLEQGSAVNLEPSCTPNSLLGGHIVQGHVEGVGEVIKIASDDGYAVSIRPPEGLMSCITPKGSVTIDGISLTVAGVDVEAGTFWVALIPTTLSQTTIGAAKVGTRFNLETDIMARTVVHYLKNYSDGAS
jgi:riboflavin synthase